MQGLFRIWSCATSLAGLHVTQMDLMPVTNVVVLEQEAALHVMQEKLMPVGRVAEHA